MLTGMAQPLLNKLAPNQPVLIRGSYKDERTGRKRSFTREGRVLAVAYDEGVAIVDQYEYAELCVNKHGYVELDEGGSTTTMQLEIPDKNRARRMQKRIVQALLEELEIAFAQV